MKKNIVCLGLSCLLLASCSSGHNPTIEEQLFNDYNFDNLNVELDDYDEMYQNSIKSSFLILNCVDSPRGPQITSTGSGFAYKTFGENDYYIITNHHVAPDNTRTYFVVTYTGQIIPAEFIGTGGSEPNSKNDFLDCSVLKAKDVEGMQVANIVNNGNYKEMTPPQTGDKIYALGNPANINLFGTISSGVVSNGRRVIKNSSRQDLMLQEHAIQIDLPINPGNSGGPLFNENGEVIGVNTFKLTKNQSGETLTGLNFSLPIHDMVIVANYIIDNYKGAPIRYRAFSLGNVNLIDIDDLTLAERKQYNIPDNILKGIYVKYSNNSTLPSKSIITKASEYEIIDSYDLRRAILEKEDNSLSVSIIDENGLNKDITVTLVK